MSDGDENPALGYYGGSEATQGYFSSSQRAHFTGYGGMKSSRDKFQHRADEVMGVTMLQDAALRLGPKFI